VSGMKIPFNRPYMSGNELSNINQAHSSGNLSGDGLFTDKCHEWLEGKTGTSKALLTHSCTAALEMAAILADIKEGDEVIMPSYTFVSTANAFVLRGAKPSFIDVREDTFNLDENLIEEAITGKTKAIVPVHYAGVSCEMDAIIEIANKYKLMVIEDAAQGVMSTYKGKALGSVGDLGAYSFHETKNLICGEGGALLVNNIQYKERAEIIREKGTDRSKFCRNEIDKYTWQGIGSSFLPSELNAAFLSAQFEKAESITNKRLFLWGYYHKALEEIEAEGLIRRPVIPSSCEHNAHMYYVVVNDSVNRDSIIRSLNVQGINAIFHYVPLHSSPAGVRFGRVNGSLSVTDKISSKIIRLPLWIGMTEVMIDYIVSHLSEILKS